MADPDWHSQYGSGDGSKKFPKWWIRIRILHTDLLIDPRCFSNGGSGSASSIRIRRWIQEVSQMVDPDLYPPYGSDDRSKMFLKWWIWFRILHADPAMDPRGFSYGGSGFVSSMRIWRWIQEVSQIVDPDLHCPCGSGDDSKRLPMDDESDSASQTEEIKINRNDLQYI